jgi:hypothetical protein
MTTGLDSSRVRFARLAFGIACAVIAATTILTVQFGAAGRMPLAGPALAAQSGESAEASPLSLPEAQLVGQSAPEPATLPLFAVKEVLKGSFFAWSTGSTSLASGFNAVGEPFRFKCPSLKHCTLEAQEFFQASTGTSGNRWAFCAQVDGNYMNQPGCAYVGTIQVTTYGAATAAEAATVSPGAHTVQMFIYADAAATLANWRVTYRLYVP